MYHGPSPYISFRLFDPQPPALYLSSCSPAIFSSSDKSAFSAKHISAVSHCEPPTNYHHQSTTTTIAVTLSRRHSSSSLFHLFFAFFSISSLCDGAEIRNAGPTLPVDVSMINRPLTRTRNYYKYNCAGNWAHIYLVLDKRTGSRNKVTIVELGSVNLAKPSVL